MALKAEILTAALALSLAACTVKPVRDREDVAAALRERTGHDTAPPGVTEPLPPGVVTDDGLSEDEAVAVALWNNPDFQVDLAELGFARADLLRAGLLRNPVLSLLFPTGSKQVEATLAWPLDALWKRGRRIDVAQLDLEALAERLVQDGLALAMRVKIAHADLVLAEEELRLAESAAELENEHAELTGARLRAGDVSGIEADETRARALEADLARSRARPVREIAEARLVALLGLAEGELEVATRETEAPPLAALPEPRELLTQALAARPELRAAELLIEAAGREAGLAQEQILSISGLIDANEREGESGYDVGPGVELALPLFDRGQAERTAAAAKLEQAVLRYSSVRNRIALEVREAHAQLLDAQQALLAWRGGVLKLRGEQVEQARRALDAGELSRLDLAVVELQRLAAESREAGVEAELRRARARLEQAIGRRLEGES